MGLCKKNASSVGKVLIVPEILDEQIAIQDVVDVRCFSYIGEDTQAAGRTRCKIPPAFKARLEHTAGGKTSRPAAH